MRKLGGRKFIVVIFLGFSGWISSQLWGSSFFSASESVQTDSVEDTSYRSEEEPESTLLPDKLAAVEIDDKETDKPSETLASDNEAEKPTASTLLQKPVEQQQAAARALKKPGSNTSEAAATDTHNESAGHDDDLWNKTSSSSKNTTNTQAPASSEPSTHSSDHDHPTSHEKADDANHDESNKHNGTHTNTDNSGATNNTDHKNTHESADKGNDHKDSDSSDHTGHTEQNHETSVTKAAQNYAASVALIKASTVRNHAEDNSRYRDTPSSELYNKADLYGSARDYIVGSGFYNGPEWFPGGYFPNNGAGTFRANCEVSHFSYDDPIVFPGQPEAAHLHMFLGNTDTNAFSTYDTLLNSGGSTCNGGELNRTAYWVPAMFDGKENVVVPSKVLFYYKTEKPAGIGKVQPYPENLQLIGDTTNNKQDNLGLSTFRCNTIYNGAKTQPSATIPKCASSVSNQPGALEYMIFYDYCWNGNEDTVDEWEANRDKNFTAPLNYWHSSVCPSSHPVLLPALVTHIFYDIKPGDDTSKWFLSSDVDADSRVQTQPGGSTAHADWFGAWNKQINKEWVDNCSNVLNAECGSGLLADPEGDPDSDVRALRLRNDFVTGYNSPKARIPVKDIYDQMCSQSETKPYSSAQGGALAAYCKPEAHKH